MITDERSGGGETQGGCVHLFEEKQTFLKVVITKFFYLCRFGEDDLEGTSLKDGVDDQVGDEDVVDAQVGDEDDEANEDVQDDTVDQCGKEYKNDNFALEDDVYVLDDMYVTNDMYMKDDMCDKDNNGTKDKNHVRDDKCRKDDTKAINDQYDGVDKNIDMHFDHNGSLNTSQKKVVDTSIYNVQKISK